MSLIHKSGQQNNRTLRYHAWLRAAACAIRHCHFFHLACESYSYCTQPHCCSCASCSDFRHYTAFAVMRAGQSVSMVVSPNLRPALPGALPCGRGLLLCGLMGLVHGDDQHASRNRALPPQRYQQRGLKWFAAACYWLMCLLTPVWAPHLHSTCTLPELLCVAVR